MIGRIPLWMHGALRILLPLPCAIASTVLYVLACKALFGHLEAREWKWLFIGLVIAGIAVFAAGIFLPKLLMRAFRVPCRSCGKIARFPARARPANGDYECESCGAQFSSHWDPGALIGGLTAVVLGFTVMVVTMTPAARANGNMPLPAFLIGLLFFCIGVGLVGGVPLREWIFSKIPAAAKVPWGMLLGGIAAAVPGIFFIILGIFSKDESSMPAGRAPVIAAGFVFAFTGIALLLGTLAELFPRLRNTLPGFGHITGILLLVSFALVPIFLAIHESKTGFPHPVLILSAGSIILLLVLAAWHGLKKWRNRG